MIHLQQCILRLFCTGLRALWYLHEPEEQGIYWMLVSHADSEHPSTQPRRERERENSFLTVFSLLTLELLLSFSLGYFCWFFLFYFILILAAPCLKANHTCVLHYKPQPVIPHCKVWLTAKDVKVKYLCCWINVLNVRLTPLSFMFYVAKNLVKEVWQSYFFFT